MKKEFIFLGPPACGKGTQTERLAQFLNFPHIDTGSLLRAEIAKETEEGKIAKSFIDKGQLVPDEVTCKIVENRINKPDCKDGYMLDGFPRTLVQAEALDKITKIDLVINIDVDFSLILGRICGRRVCKACGETYHTSKIGEATVCAKCGGELYQRKDDNPETVQSRLDVYNAQTTPLIEYYQKKGLLFSVDGSTTPEYVYDVVSKKLDSLKK